jgi:DNA-binding transcriptional LysR family regulator
VSARALAALPADGWGGPVVSLGERELVLVARPDDGPTEPVPAAELAARTLVVLESDEPLVLAALAAAGVEPAAILRTDSAEHALALVGAGAGAALLDEAVLGPHSALRGRRLAEPPRREWALFASGAWTPLALDVVSAVAVLAGEPVAVA